MRSVLIVRHTTWILGSLLLITIAGVVVAGSGGSASDSPAVGSLGGPAATEELSVFDFSAIFPDSLQRLMQGPRRSPRVVPAPDRGTRSGPCLTASDPHCARAQAIAAMGACTRPEDCPAVDAWRDLMGTPAIELAVPVSAEPVSRERLPLMRPREEPPSASDLGQADSIEDEAVNGPAAAVARQGAEIAVMGLDLSPRHSPQVRKNALPMRYATSRCSRAGRGSSSAREGPRCRAERVALFGDAEGRKES
jgi:hypothetical protein